MGRTQAQKRGYTVVELMMALAIFSIGVTGLVATEVVTSRSNLHAKDLAVATQFARSWQERLAMDGTLWGGPSSWPITNTTWLDAVETTTNATWTLPATSGTFGPAAGSRGEEVGLTASYFCTHIRLTKLVNRLGSGLVRSEVRVFWPKGPVAWSDGDPYCDAGADVGAIGAATDSFHFVYTATTIRETPKF